MTNNDVYLTASELKNLKPHYLAEGSDAKVYKINRNILYKIYHTENEGIRVDNEAETKVVNSIKDIGIKELESKTIDYVDINGVKINKEDAIRKAIERRQNVLFTSLPMGCIYVDGHFRGCVIKNHNPAIPFHNINMFPKKTKLKIIKDLLLEVEELLNNYIYHVDLANKPSFVDFRKTHSNILVKYNWHYGFHPEIIDIDGKSAFYREKFDAKFYYNCMYSLKILLIELFCDIENVEEIYESKKDIEYLEFSFREDELKYNLICELENDDTNIDGIRKIFKI